MPPLPADPAVSRSPAHAPGLAPSWSAEMALVYERAKQKGNRNRATLAVARKLVAYLMAVDRELRPFDTQIRVAGNAA